MALVRLMPQTTRPIVERFGGTVLKFEADIPFALFNRAKAALDAAVAMNGAFEPAKFVMGPVSDIGIGIGIDKGARSTRTVRTPSASRSTAHPSSAKTPPKPGRS